MIWSISKGSERIDTCVSSSVYCQAAVRSYVSKGSPQIAHSADSEVIRPLSLEQQTAFDCLLDSTLSRGGNSLIDYNLPYQKVDFLNYICDWRGYVAHAPPCKT